MYFIELYNQKAILIKSHSLSHGTRTYTGNLKYMRDYYVDLKKQHIKIYYLDTLENFILRSLKISSKISST